MEQNLMENNIQELKNLIEQYQKRVKTLTKEIDLSTDGITSTRLTTKRAVYRTVLTDLEKLVK